MPRAFATWRCPSRSCKALSRRRLRVAVAHPGGDDPGAAVRRRHARPGADRHRQDRRFRAAGADPASTCRNHEPQVLVLVPTRELALQVAEAFQRYAAHMQGLSRAADLRRPELPAAAERAAARRARGRGHARAGHRSHEPRHARSSAGLTLLVLDEADEMLRMGFLDAVESILEQTPPQRQVALFSATMSAADPAHRAEAPALAGRSDHQEPRPARPPTSASATGW